MSSNGCPYLQAAVRAGECVWQRGLLRKGVSLCHGVAGNGYAFLRLWRTTGDPHWLNRAQQYGLFLERRVELTSQRQMRCPDNPHSLFEGVAGAACYIADLLKLDADSAADIRFPAFEV